jgi:hypothetical protein
MNRSIRLVALAALILSAAPIFADGPLRFFPITPCRIVDTRQAGFGGILLGKSTRNFQVQGKCGIPVNAKAVALNATIIGPQSDGYITLFPSGTPWPGTANMTFKAAEPALGNGAIVALSTSAADLSVYLFQSTVTQTAHLALDGTGYFCKVDAGGACIP